MKKLLISLGVVSSFFCAMASVAIAQEDQLVQRPAKCNFDSDNQADDVTVVGSLATIVMSKNGNTKTFTFNQAFPFWQCLDKDGNKKADTLRGSTRKNGKGRLQTKTVVKLQNKLGAVCPAGVRELRSCEIYKSEASKHITDARKNSTSFIANRNCPGSYPRLITAYDKNGNEIHRMGEYLPSGSFYDSRHYGCYAGGDCKNPRSLANEARNRTGSEEIYLKDSQNFCVRVPDAGQCYNSVGC